MLNDIGGRKFIFAMFVVMLGFVLVMGIKTTAQEWFSFVQVIGGIYVAGNVLEKFSATKQQ